MPAGEQGSDHDDLVRLPAWQGGVAHPVECQVRRGRMEEIRSAAQAALGECPPRVRRGRMEEIWSARSPRKWPRRGHGQGSQDSSDESTEAGQFGLLILAMGVETRG